MTGESTSLVLVLHAHLPFVRHPEHPAFLEETWLFEAITECYLPLLIRLRRLVREGFAVPLAINLTPTLCEMLEDDLLQQRYRARLGKLLELAEREMDRNRRQPSLYNTALHYYESLSAAQTLYNETLGGDLLGAFRDLQAHGLELLASAATHPVLPLLSDPASQRAQIRIGVEGFTKRFGHPPRGFWLPECAFAPDLDVLLAEAGLTHFFLDAHGMLFGRPRPQSGIFAPVDTPSGVACFARDAESTRQVWSARDGYPGDPVYREYYRDLGHDAEETYIRPYLLTETGRHNVGVKYHRITGQVPLADKAFYAPDAACAKAREHAADFLHARAAQAQRLRDVLPHAPVIVAPYDAELFGHWWYEGPAFLEEVLRLAGAPRSPVRVRTPAAVLDSWPARQVLVPSASSWGYNGYFETWLSGVNDWMYPDLHQAEATLQRLVMGYAEANDRNRAALDQLARELLLAQASDWAFILSTGTMPTYARGRIESHLARFHEIAQMLEADAVSPERIAAIRAQDNLFPTLRADVFLR